MGRLTTGESTPISDAALTRSTRMSLKTGIIAAACFTVAALSLACMAGCQSSEE